MAWTTNQLAELAGTSLRTVRHYHQVGLLPEPQRRANGYKDYGVAHLVRLLRIKRLAELGFSLAQIAGMDELDDHPREALQAMEAELATTIDGLERRRAELATILETDAQPDLPAELAPVGAPDVSADVRSLALVVSRVIGPSGMRTYQQALKSDLTDPAVVELESLPADADERTRQDLAQRLLPFNRAAQAEHPGIDKVFADAPRGEKFAARTVGMALAELLNPAQLDVLVRLGRALESSPAADGD